MYDRPTQKFAVLGNARLMWVGLPLSGQEADRHG